MKALWHAWAAKLNDLPLRERALAFVAAAGLLVLLAYVLALQPLLRQQRGYLERINLDQAQLKSIDDELVKGAKSSKEDAQPAKRDHAARLEASLAAAEKLLTQRRNAERLSSEQLTHMIRDVLGRNSNLQLLALRVLPGISLPAPGQAATPGKPGAPTQLYRHGVEVEMTGTYLELLRYLENVEALPWKLAWTNVELKTMVYPQVQMRATLYAVSPSPVLLTF